MMLLINFLIIALAAVKGNVVTNYMERNGDLNKYYLYLPEDPMVGYEIKPTEVQVDSQPTEVDHLVDATLPTVIIVHGHDGTAFSTINPQVKNALLKHHAANAIVVDWSAYTHQSYSFASAAVASVGQSLGKFLRGYVDEGLIRLEELHLVGFNLGAHVVGFAGRALDGKAARITGLDPSSSQWGSGTPRLSKSDAAYVEVLHTDGSGLLANGLGVELGHVDFFVNGGSNQPGCLTHACSHHRAYEVFAATLERDEDLYGNLCRSNLQMTMNRCGSPILHVGGTDMKKVYTEGSYRVNTGRNYPFF